MKIGELAAATGLAPSAIRFYEQSGLLPAAQRAANGYRSYSTEAVERLRFIQLAQALGFTLDTLRAGLVSRGTPSKSKDELQDEMLQRLDTRLAEVDHMLATLRSQRKDLLAVRERLLATWATGECLDPASVQLTPVEPAAPAPARPRRITPAPAQAPRPAPARRAQRR
jgi:DNA-binding transcriptional MerR regulator